MEEINTSRLCSDIDETLNRFKLLETSFKENLDKERHALQETVDAFDNELVKLSETKSALLKKIKIQSNTTRENKERLSKLNQSSTTDELSEYKLEAETSSKEKEKLEALVNQQQTLLEHKKAERISRKASDLENEAKDKAELMAYIKCTQLVMLPEKDNHIRFMFRNINEVDSEKVFYFILYLSESSVYKVTECQPEIPGVDLITAKVNTDRHLASFIKRMRRSFVEIDKLSSSSSSPHP